MAGREMRTMAPDAEAKQVISMPTDNISSCSAARVLHRLPLARGRGS